MYVIILINNDNDIFINKQKANIYLLSNTAKELETYVHNWACVVHGKPCSAQKNSKRFNTEICRYILHGASYALEVKDVDNV